MDDEDDDWNFEDLDPSDVDTATTRQPPAGYTPLEDPRGAEDDGSFEWDASPHISPAPSDPAPATRTDIGLLPLPGASCLLVRRWLRCRAASREQAEDDVDTVS